MASSCKKRSKTKTDNGTKKKRRSTILQSVYMNSIYEAVSYNNKFRKTEKNEDPFDHWHLHNLIDNSTGYVEDLELELQEFDEWRRKENDLYSLYQTQDLKAIDSTKHSNIFAFRQFLYTDLKTWLETVSGVKLLDSVDCNGSLYSETDGLLPHSDQIGTRRFAFVYYLTEFPWKKEYGGNLLLYNSNDNNEPTTVAKQLAPVRNSLVIFEVTGRSWHQVAEILSDSPRLSINGWFHSERVLDAPSLPPFIVPRSCDSITTLAVKDWVNNSYLNSERQSTVQNHFGDNSEISMHDFLTEVKYNACLKSLRNMSLARVGPPHRRNFGIVEDTNLDEVKELKEVFKSVEMKKLIEDLTGCELNGCSSSIEMASFSAGDYSVLSDRDMEQSEQDGYCLDIHMFLGEGCWSEEAGGQIVYVEKDDEEVLISLSPCGNVAGVALRDPKVFYFHKYANKRAIGTFYVLTLTYYNVPVSDSDDESNSENDE